MTLPALPALIFMPVVIPLCLAAMWTDLTRMKIPNWITDVMLVAFIPLGLIAFPWEMAAWQLLHPAVMLAIGLVMHAARLTGGGDIKFMVAASPYVMRADIWQVLLILCLALLVGYAVHAVLKRSPVAKATPDWASWKAKGRYPMALSLGPTMIAYLVISATQ